MFMDAEIITYETKNMTNNERSSVSKRLFGFKDRTKESKYIYERKGSLATIPHIVVTKKTFVVSTTHVRKIKNMIKEWGVEVKSWKIKINQKELKKRCG